MDRLGPRRRRSVAIGMLSGVVGGLAVAAAVRVSMRLLLLLGGVRPEGGTMPLFTLEGTLGIFLTLSPVGIPFGVLYAALRKRLPGPWLAHGLAYGALLFLVLGVPFFLGDEEIHTLPPSPTVGLLLFGPPIFLYGIVVAGASAWLDRRMPLVVRPGAPAAVGYALLAAAGLVGLGFVLVGLPQLYVNAVQRFGDPTRNVAILVAALLAAGLFLYFARRATTSLS